MSIERQISILNEISRIMHRSASAEYDEIFCEFDHENYEGGWSVGSKYHFIINGVEVSEFLDDPDDLVSSLVHELHDVMYSHTGGDWKRFMISIDRSGRASTKFVY